jgi:TPR repeat protein
VNGAPTGRGDKRRRSRASAVPRLALVASLAATLIGALGSTQAWAQASARPGITVAATISAEPAGETAFGIRVGPADAVPRNSFLRVRGLPPMAALSEGHSIAPGTWAVSLAALPDLRIMLPAGAAGRSEIVITLVGVDGSVLAEANATLAIAAARQLERGQPRRDATGPPNTATILRAGTPLQPPPEAADPRGPVPPAPAVTPQDRERAQRLLNKGDAQLEEGNVSAARLLYERAAEAGLAQAAMALAATFDAAEFARLKLRGIDADPKEARRWYERARQLGAADAEERLRRIGGR